MLRVRTKEAKHALRQVVRDGAQRCLHARASRKLDRVCVSKAGPEVPELFYEQVIERQPDRPSPVGVGAKQRYWRLRWRVFDRRLEAVVAASARSDQEAAPFSTFSLSLSLFLSHTHTTRLK